MAVHDVESCRRGVYLNYHRGMKLPTLFISHGGGPWPWIEERRADFAGTFSWLQQLPATLPEKPRAILSVSGHWEEADFTVATSPRTADGVRLLRFPRAHLSHPVLRARLAVRSRNVCATLLEGAGIHIAEDAERGFDHGTFVPLAVMYPNADVPIVSLSLRASLNADGAHPHGRGACNHCVTKAC